MQDTACMQPRSRGGEVRGSFHTPITLKLLIEYPPNFAGGSIIITNAMLPENFSIHDKLVHL